MGHEVKKCQTSVFIINLNIGLATVYLQIFPNYWYKTKVTFHNRKTLQYIDEWFKMYRVIIVVQVALYGDLYNNTPWGICGGTQERCPYWSLKNCKEKEKGKKLK